MSAHTRAKLIAVLYTLALFATLVFMVVSWR